MIVKNKTMFQRNQSLKRKRGPYKLYLHDDSKRIPVSTVRSWAKQAATIQHHGADCSQEIPIEDEQHTETPHSEPALHLETPDSIQEECSEPLHSDSELDLTESTPSNDSFTLSSDELHQITSSEQLMEESEIDDGTEQDLHHCQQDVHIDEGEEYVRQPPQQSKIRKSYVMKYSLNDLLHPSLSITKLETMVAILHIALRHCHVNPFIEDMLKFVNLIIGENVLKTSAYLFHQVFSASSNMFVHYYCPICGTYLGEKSSFSEDMKVKTCACGENCNVSSMNGSNYFITFSITQQIESLLNSGSVKIIPHLNRAQDGVIKDVMDSKLYQQLCQAGKPLSNKDAISISFNTDGASPFSKSSRGSLWPIHFVINEVDAHERFKSDHILLAGLWYGSSSPDMQMFFKPFVEEINRLTTEGVKHHVSENTVITRPVIAFACTVDSVAKAKVQCVKQYNGIYGCGYCYHPNPCVPSDNNRHHYTTDETFPLRTHEQMESDMLKANELDAAGKLKKSKKKGEETDDSVNGVRGISVLLLLTYFNIVWSFVIDYMHNICEGLAEYIFDLFLSSPVLRGNERNKSKVLSSDNRNILNERLSRIFPPHEVSRRPRSTAEKKLWKAKEWRAFILYYSLPCLQDLIPQRHFNNFKLLVRAVFIMLKDNIHTNELEEAKRLLDEFVVDFECLYGTEHCTYNLHILTHWAFSVMMVGSPWATSNFPFERANGYLLNLISTRNTGGLTFNIAKKYLTIQTAASYFKENVISDSVKQFCEKLVGRPYLKNSEEISETLCLGRLSSWVINEEERNVLREADELFADESEMKFYNRVIQNHVMYYSRAYTKPKVFDDSCAMLADATYAEIDKIFKSSKSGKLLALIKPIVFLPADQHIVPHIKSTIPDMYAPLKLINFEFVVKKCVKLSVDGHNYVCDMPNTFEKD